MNIVLYQPEIPHNTGAIGRTCLMAGAVLHLIRPYGFFLDDASLKRAGMDYWRRVDVREYDCFADFAAKNAARHDGSRARFWFAETGGDACYADKTYSRGDYFIFGSETGGLPRAILDEHQCNGNIISIPMISEITDRSLNLSVSVGIILFEALRQTGFSGMGF